MKTVRIKDEEVGLVYRKGEFDRLLTKVKYWVRSSDVVTICNTNEQFIPEGDLKRLLKHAELADELTVVELTETQVALMFECGNFSRLLKAGIYAFWKDEKRYSFTKYDRSLSFNPTVPLSVLLKDEALADELIVPEIKEEQIALLYVDGIFAHVLSPGKYAFWKGVKSYSFDYIDISSTEMIADVKTAILMKREILSYIRVFEVFPSELGVLFVDGKYVGTLQSGTYYFWKNATPIAVIKADTRQVALEVSGQEILTKDKAGLRVNFQVLYKVVDIEKALIDNRDFEKQLYTLVQLALREFVSTYTLDELLEKKDEIGEYVKASLAAKSDALGVKI
ncbi:MAG: SPFH domain-containing protein, partial [Bacteroidota bacterium]